VCQQSREVLSSGVGISLTANGSLSSRHEYSFQCVKLQYVKT